ncbi:MAG: histidinol-phosphatase [Candidatus Lokiarchaeota archaeon]|nr:histidinol-phosphatase [Candidatus Lokiarchaeota archaeon]
MVDVSIKDRRKYLSEATRIAVVAGEITLKYFLSSPEIEIKDDMTPVTKADRLTERYIRDELLKHFPKHGLVGEEFGTRKSDSPFRWLIDPIDGTKSFIHGVPLYTVLISLLYEEEPILGVIHNPPSGETVSAAIGLGCIHGKAHCKVGDVTELSEARVQVTDYADLVTYRPEFSEQLLRTAKSCRTYGDAYGYLFVASGRADVMIDPIMKPWDIAPLKPIITEAGGVFSDLDGNDEALGTSALAANKDLHKQVLDLVKACDK